MRTRPPTEEPRELSTLERKAWHMGYLAALGDLEAKVSERRIRIAAKSLKVEPPKSWPTVGKRGGGR